MRESTGADRLCFCDTVGSSRPSGRRIIPPLLFAPLSIQLPRRLGFALANSIAALLGAASTAVHVTSTALGSGQETQAFEEL